MKKQTAVEYLIQEINHDACAQNKSIAEWFEVFEKAKTMEREQVVDAFITAHEYEHGDIARAWFGKDAMKYYNETYGGEQ